MASYSFGNQLTTTGSIYGTDIIMDPYSRQVKTVHQEIELKRMKEELEFIQRQSMTAPLGNYLTTYVCAGDITVCDIAGTTTVSTPTKKDTNKIKNLIAYYYKR